MDDHTNTDQNDAQKPLDNCNECNECNKDIVEDKSNEDILLTTELMRMISEFDCPANYYDDNNYNDGLIFTSYTLGFTDSKK